MERRRRLRDVTAREIRAAVVADLGPRQVEGPQAGQSIAFAPPPPIRRSRSPHRRGPRPGPPRRTWRPRPCSWSFDELIMRGPLDRPQHPDRDREVRVGHPREHQGEVRILGGLIVHQQVGLGDAVLPDGDDLGVQAVEADALVAVLAEDHRLAVLEDEHPVLADLAVREVAPRPVVEDVAVLEDLDEARALVPAGALEGVLEVLRVRVDRAGDEARLGGQRDGQRDDRRVDRAHRRRLRPLPELRRRRGLALGQPVDAVVEHDHVDVDVAAHRVDDVVAADRERVAVAGDDPDHQVRPRGLEPGRERRRAAVDRVEAERVHVVRQAARSSRCRR